MLILKNQQKEQNQLQLKADDLKKLKVRNPKKQFRTKNQ